jgi:hypothetical protein
MEPLWSPVVATSGNQVQSDVARKPLKQAKSVATGCHRLRETFHGKQGVCPGCGGPLPAKEEVDRCWIVERDYFLAQSGHGHWSQAHPVHASRIIRGCIRCWLDARTVLSTRRESCAPCRDMRTRTALVSARGRDRSSLVDDAQYRLLSVLFILGVRAAATTDEQPEQSSDSEVQEREQDPAILAAAPSQRPRHE